MRKRKKKKNRKARKSLKSNYSLLLNKVAERVVKNKELKT